MEASPTYSSPGNSAASRFIRVQPDAVLCRLASRGNAQAYDVLYERYRKPVYAFVYHLLGRGGSGEDAEDIAQEAFTKGFAAIRNRGFEGSFKHWIFTIARNRAFDVMRASRPVGSLDADDAVTDPVDPQAGTADRAEQRAELAWLVTTVAELPERQREALLMRELGGLSHREIADELGTTVSATKKLINRGRSSVTEAASLDGYRERKLGRDLALSAPVLPIAAAGIGMSMAGGAATAGAAAGGGLAISKIAASMLTVAAVGGGTAVVEHERQRPAGSEVAVVAEARDRAGSPLQVAPAEVPALKTVKQESAGSGRADDSADRRGDGRRGRGSEDSAGEERRGSDDDGSWEDTRGRRDEREGDDQRGSLRGDGSLRGGDRSGPGDGDDHNESPDSDARSGISEGSSGSGGGHEDEPPDTGPDGGGHEGGGED